MTIALLLLAILGVSLLAAGLFVLMAIGDRLNQLYVLHVELVKLERERKQRVEKAAGFGRELLRARLALKNA
jgi:hypothetical protein